MTPACRRCLFLLTTGHQLLRGPTGWRCVAGAAFERVRADTVGELLEADWVERAVGDASPVYDIADAGRQALAEPD